jgi:hypothetical protein
MRLGVTFIHMIGFQAIGKFDHRALIAPLFQSAEIKVMHDQNKPGTQPERCGWP